MNQNLYQHRFLLSAQPKVFFFIHQILFLLFMFTKISNKLFLFTLATQTLVIHRTLRKKIINWRRKKMRVDRLFARCKLNRNEFDHCSFGWAADTQCVVTAYIRLRIVMRLLLVWRYEAVAGDPTRYRHNYTHVFYLVENRLYFVLLLLLLLLLLLPSSPPSS